MEGSSESTPLTAERFVPEAQRRELIEAEHLARYVWAAQLAQGRTVLDAGCGLGYGTAIMARAGALAAYGVDIDVDAIMRAHEQFSDEAGFGGGDLLALPFPRDAFDLVVCFEALEHVADPERALDELHRVLRSEGVLVVSSPNRGVYPSGNPFHLHEYTSEELEETLNKRFDNVRVMRQSVHLTSLITDDRGVVAEDPEVEVAASLRKLEPQAPGEEMIAIGVAADVALPELERIGMVTGMLTLKTWVEEILNWSERARRAEAELLYARGQVGQAERERELAVAELEALREKLGS
jgi:ubiquinone/menaquinone biosynthesis C-methylase UbiE